MRIAFVGDSLTEGRPGSSYFAILQERLAGHTLINLGKGNDTVVSLHRRLAKLRCGEPFDMVFLWIGVNDVSGGSPWPFQVVNTLLRQPCAKNLREFQACYRATLDLLCRNARRVIAVPPLLKGEDTGNPWNRDLAVLARTIEETVSHYEQVEYLDLRPIFAQKLADKLISAYVPRSVIRVALDALTLTGKEQVDRKATERGLHFTLDGIHLNSAGAGLVAEAFLGAITGGSQKS
jgi:lysophospholipase L1-like esterase